MNFSEEAAIKQIEYSLNLWHEKLEIVIRAALYIGLASLLDHTRRFKRQTYWFL